MKNIITRIAPSPTNSFMHLGNLRTLLYNYFLAKRHGGKFYVRLEDTDRDRYTSSFLTYFKDTCDWLGIVPDASYWSPDPSIGSFTQSERDYSKYVKVLLDKGLAYYAFDTKDDLDVLKSKGLKYDSTTRMSMNNSLTNPSTDVMLQSGVPYVIRFAVTPDIDVTFDDAILGTITINTNTLDDKVLIKSNGIGSYHLCNVCDDHGKGKLSKRTAMKYGIPIAPIGYTDDSGTYVPGWKDLGYDPKAFMNALALIGWNPGDDVEIMSMSDMINSFSLDRVNKSGARFDMDKAKWINAYHLRMTSNSCLKPFINIKDDRYSDDKLDMIINLAKERSNFKSDLNLIVDLFYNNPIITDVKKLDDNFIKVFSKFILSDVDYTSSDSIKDSILSVCNDVDVKIGKVMPGLRMALVGGISGPDLPTTMFILGKDEVIKRISTSLPVLN